MSQKVSSCTKEESRDRKCKNDKSLCSGSGGSNKSSLSNSEEATQGSYLEKEKKVPKLSCSRSLCDNSGLLWHKRLNHILKGQLEYAACNIPCLKGIKFGQDILDCLACAPAKITRLPNKVESYRYTKPLVLIHSDSLGPVTPTFIHKKQLATTYINDFSRCTIVYTSTHKYEAHKGLLNYLDEMRIIIGQDARCFQIQLDNGTEFLTAAMKEVLKKENISLAPIEPYTPTHSGTAERFNRELEEKARALLIDAGLPTTFWDYVIGFVAHVYNCTSKKSLNYEMPYERLHK